MKKRGLNYKVSIWPGFGYQVVNFIIRANSVEESLERVAACCELKGLSDLYLTNEGVEDLGLTDEEVEEMFFYVDPSVVNSNCTPIYFRVENLGIEELKK